MLFSCVSHALLILFSLRRVHRVFERCVVQVAGLVERVLAMAARLGVSTFQVLLRWTLQAGHVALFTTTSETHLRNDIDLFAFELAPADLAEMATWDADIHTGWDPANWADTFVH